MKRINNVSRKRLWLLGGLIVALVAVVTYAGLSFHHWRSVDNDSTQRMRINKKDALQATDSSREANDRRELITKLSATEEDIENLCDSWWGYRWQATVFPAVRTLQSDCVDTKSKLTKLVAVAQGAQRYLKSEDRVIEILRTLSVDTKAKTLTEKQWSTTAETVSTAATAMKKLEASGSLIVVKKEAVKRVTSLDSAWNTMLAAHKKQNKSAYIAAVDELDQAYANLASISDVADEQLSGVVGNLVTVTKQL